MKLILDISIGGREALGPNRRSLSCEGPHEQRDDRPYRNNRETLVERIEAIKKTLIERIEAHAKEG